MGAAVTLLREFDFREVSIPEKMLIIKVEQSVIDEGLAAAAERFLTIEPAEDGIRTGDIVRVSYPDEEAEGGITQAQLAVGRYFFDRQLEEALLGMARGETAQLPVKGRTRLLTICSVKRRRIPPLTDEAVAGMEIEGVHTLAAYRQYLIDRRAEAKRMERDRILTDFVEKQVVARSDFTPVDRTVEEYLACYRHSRSLAREFAGQDADTTELEALRRMLNQRKEAGEEEILTALAEDCDRRMKCAALGRAHARQDGVEYTTADCDRELREFAQMRGVPYEELAKQYAPDYLLAEKYIQHFSSKILAHYQRQYTVAVE